MSGFWEVPALEAINADKALLVHLSQNGLQGRLSLPIEDYGRQYLGFIRNGERWIYVNAFPARKKSGMLDRARSEFIGGCDGGALFWGIEFNAQMKLFAAFAANGDVPAQ
jgi:hypothetical protein